MKTLARFMKDESGATAIEYGLIAACISSRHRSGSGHRHQAELDLHQRQDALQ